MAYNRLANQQILEPRRPETQIPDQESPAVKENTKHRLCRPCHGPFVAWQSAVHFEVGNGVDGIWKRGRVGCEFELSSR